MDGVGMSRLGTGVCLAVVYQASMYDHETAPGDL